MLRKINASFLVVAVLTQLFALTACTRSQGTGSGTGSGLDLNGHVTAWVGYQLPFLPIEFVWDSDGKFSIKAKASIATPIGTVSFGPGYTPTLVASRHWTEPSVPEPVGDLDVIIRDIARNEGQIYSISSNDQEFIAVINGSANLKIKNRQIIIDISNGQVTANMVAGQFTSLGILPAPVLGEFIPDDTLVAQYPGSFPQKISNCESQNESLVTFPNTSVEPFSTTPKGDIEWEIEGTPTKGSGSHLNGGKLPIELDLTQTLSAYRTDPSAAPQARSIRWQVRVQGNSESECMLKWWEIWRQGHIDVFLLDRKIARIAIRYFSDVDFNYAVTSTRSCGQPIVERPREQIGPRASTTSIPRPTTAPPSIGGLRIAAQNGNKVEIELWLNRGIPLNATDANGRTALMITAGNGHSDATKYLLERGADINVQDGDGRTALIIAVIGGHDDTVKLLLRWRADVNVVDAAGRTALAEARGRNNRQIARLLESAGAWR
jgi:uncharacterized protein